MRALCVAPSGNACTASEYNFNFVDFHTKNAPIFGAFLLSLLEQLNLPLQASKVYFVSEVIFNSEVSPRGEVGKFNFT